MPFTVIQATEADIQAITEIFCDETEHSELNELQRGTAKEENMLDKMAARHLSNMQKGEQVYVVAKDDETGAVVSYSQWLLPKNEKIPDEATLARETEEFRKSLPEGMNIELTSEFRDKVLAMRHDSSKGRRHYELLNLGTNPSYRRRGAASALVKWAFPKADEEGIQIYLDTAEDGNARGMYERLGFVLAGEMQVDLRKYGGTSVHTHIAMIREPNVTRYL